MFYSQLCRALEAAVGTLHKTVMDSASHSCTPPLALTTTASRSFDSQRSSLFSTNSIEDMTAAHEPSPPSPSGVNLLSLPPELLHHIMTFVPTSSLIAVKLTNKHLFLSTRSPPPGWLKTASACEKKAARRYLSERRDRTLGRRQCTTCNLVAAEQRFPFDAPICKWHDQWFLSTTIPEFVEMRVKRQLVEMARRSSSGGSGLRTTRAGASAAAAAAVKWVALDRVYCAHTRDIVGWHVADCECTCESCGHFPVKCYVRISGKLGNPKYAELAEDKRSVSEERWMHVPGQPLRIFQDSAPVVSLSPF